MSCMPCSDQNLNLVFSFFFFSLPAAFWSRTNGVNTNGAAAKVPLSKNNNFAVTPLVLTPFVPFRALRGSTSRCPAAIFAFAAASSCCFSC